MSTSKRLPKKPLEEAPKGLLLYRGDDFDHHIDGSSLLACHWCRKPRYTESVRRVYWYEEEEGEQRVSKLCPECAGSVAACINCAAYDSDARSCNLVPPSGAAPDFPPTHDDGWCLRGFIQVHLFTKKELVALLKRPMAARLG